MKYLDPVTLARIRSLRHRELSASSEGALTGFHRSVARRGFSQEFAQHKPYSEGDDIRFMDWKVYARKDRFYVKEFHEEKSIRLHLLMDASSSMSFAGPGKASVGKWDYACRLAMSIACLSVMKGDQCGLMAFSDRNLAEIPVRGGLKQLELLDAALAGMEPSGRSSFGSVFRQFLPSAPKRSAVALFSDLMGNPREVLEAVRFLKSGKRTVYVFQVLDPSERDLPWEGAVSFLDMETGSRCGCRPAAIRDSYAEEFSRWLRLCENACGTAKIFHMTCFTDMPWDIVMGRFLAGRTV
ncbi:MAG: DUF58 domain-containing protein [bacterium]